jgi:hypothetical protein
MIGQFATQPCVTPSAGSPRSPAGLLRQQVCCGCIASGVAQVRTECLAVGSFELSQKASFLTRHRRGQGAMPHAQQLVPPQAYFTAVGIWPPRDARSAATCARGSTASAPPARGGGRTCAGKSHRTPVDLEFLDPGGGSRVHGCRGGAATVPGALPTRMVGRLIQAWPYMYCSGVCFQPLHVRAWVRPSSLTPTNLLGRQRGY